MGGAISARTKLTSGFANMLAFLSALLEGIIGLLLVLMYTIIAGIPFMQTEAWGILLEALIVTLVINFVVIGLILYTPLQEFLHYSIKLLLSSLLSLITLIALLLVTTHTEYVEFNVYAVLAAVIFIIEAFILYFINMLRRKKLALVMRHKQALDKLADITSALTEKVGDKKIYQELVKSSGAAFSTWGLILKSELLERWDLSKVFNESVLLSLVFFGISVMFKTYSNITGIYTLSVGVATFLAMLILTTYDLIKSQKVRRIL